MLKKICYIFVHNKSDVLVIIKIIKYDYEWELKNNGWNWLTNVESAFGLAKYKNAPFARKIDDRILIQSILSSLL